VVPRPEKKLNLEPQPLGSGVREFIRDLPPTAAAFVAFDTRAGSPEIFTGSAAKGIRKRLTRRGLTSLLPHQTFVVDGDSRLVEGEEERAVALGRSLADDPRLVAPPAATAAG
jgi:hypothetical protein